MGIPVFDTEIGRIAMIICMDAFFETARYPPLKAQTFSHSLLYPRAPSNYWRARRLRMECILLPIGGVVNTGSTSRGAAA